jgi:hypothetical protein
MEKPRTGIIAAVSPKATKLSDLFKTSFKRKQFLKAGQEG